MMKTLKILACLAGLLPISLIKAQDFNETLVVPLSRPTEKGKLEVSLVRGDISIVAYDSDEVVIEATSSKSVTGRGRCSDCEEDRRPSKVPPGMKRISSSSIELEASEDDNEVEIATNSWKQAVNLSIKVPKNFDLEVATVHGKLSVAGVEGLMEASSVHGALTFSEVAGAVLCNTVHGSIVATFNQVTKDEPMSFVTLHGDIDASFPGEINATTKMKSDRGEIYTDFDMVIDKSTQEKKSSKDGEYKVSVNSWVYGKINNGGAEYTFKNMHGDIIIRKE
ncbi:MAG: DUF4097 family beta strand repeat-containing protein [Bacteroidota bacterium]